MSGGSLEKLTRAVTCWRYICFLRFRGFFRGVPGFLGDVPGFLGGVPGFLGVFLVFLGVFQVFWGCSGFLGCFGMFRDVPVFWCSVFRCSGVPGSTTCPRATFFEIAICLRKTDYKF